MIWIVLHKVFLWLSLYGDNTLTDFYFILLEVLKSDNGKAAAKEVERETGFSHLQLDVLTQVS